MELLQKIFESNSYGMIQCLFCLFGASTEGKQFDKSTVEPLQVSSYLLFIVKIKRFRSRVVMETILQAYISFIEFLKRTVKRRTLQF